MKDSFYPPAIDTFFDSLLEINELFGGQENFSPWQFCFLVSLIETLENRTRVESLTDQVLFLRVKEVSDEFRVVAHTAGPEVHDF